MLPKIKRPLAGPPPADRPGGGRRLTDQELVPGFTDLAETMGAQVISVSGPEAVAAKLVEVLRPLGSKVALTACSLIRETGLEAALTQAGFLVEKDGAEFARQADIGIVEADYGIAETGTLVTDATDLKRRLASMLPLTCAVLLPAERIRANLAEVVEAYLASGPWPGYLALVTGPSRTADIERSLTIGVHGPERLLIILVGSDDCGGQ